MFIVACTQECSIFSWKFFSLSFCFCSTENIEARIPTISHIFFFPPSLFLYQSFYPIFTEDSLSSSSLSLAGTHRLNCMPISIVLRSTIKAFIGRRSVLQGWRPSRRYARASASAFFEKGNHIVLYCGIPL